MGDINWTQKPINGVIWNRIMDSMRIGKNRNNWITTSIMQLKKEENIRRNSYVMMAIRVKTLRLIFSRSIKNEHRIEY